MKEPHILYETEEHIARIIINRPDARNAFSPEMIALWREALERSRLDQNIRVIVVTGKGDTFCSGGDVRDMADGKLRSWDMKNFLWEGVHRLALALEDLDKPVIAAIMCDLRVCSDKAKMAASYIMMGLAPGDGGAYFLPRLVGIARALELLLTGRVFSAKEALDIGLVNRVVPHEKLMEEAMSLAREIASKPPLASRMIKRAVYQAQKSDLRSHLDYISSQLALLSETHDHQEAARAFLEKRKPDFKGE